MLRTCSSEGNGTRIGASELNVRHPLAARRSFSWCKIMGKALPWNFRNSLFKGGKPQVNADGRR